jgi:hypothetical protein
MMPECEIQDLLPLLIHAGSGGLGLVAQVSISYRAAVFAGIGGPEVAAGILVSPDAMVAAEGADAGPDFVTHLGEF